MLKTTALVALLVSTTAHGQCFSKDDSKKAVAPESRMSLYRGQLEFTLNLFNSINKAVPDDNIFFSPFSVYHSLLMGYFAAGAQTEEGLKEALKIEPSLVSFWNEYQLYA